MNKENILEKDMEEVSGGADEKLKFNFPMRKVTCSQCGKLFEIYDGAMGVIPTRYVLDSMNRCPKCREEKPFPEFLYAPHERWRIKNNKKEKNNE